MGMNSIVDQSEHTCCTYGGVVLRVAKQDDPFVADEFVKVWTNVRMEVSVLHNQAYLLVHLWSLPENWEQCYPGAVWIRISVVAVENDDVQGKTWGHWQRPAYGAGRPSVCDILNFRIKYLVLGDCAECEADGSFAQLLGKGLLRTYIRAGLVGYLVIASMNNCRPPFFNIH